jgi:long-subunit fatty acid transport protein
MFIAQVNPDEEITYTKATTKLKQGDTYEAGFGVAYALSYKLGLNTQYQQSITFKTKKDGEKIPGTLLNVGSLRFGGVWAWSDKTSIDLSTTIGVTADAPDTVVELRLSYKF